MTPKEKATQLYKDCAACIDYDTYVDDGVMFADIIANEVISVLSENYSRNKKLINYWEEVKKEIRKI